MWDVRDTMHIWDLKKTKIIRFVFDVYLNFLHLSYKTYAENTMFIFELSLHHICKGLADYQSNQRV